MTGPQCENEAHDEDPGANGNRPWATVRVSWPDDRFAPSYACDQCALMLVEIYVLDVEDTVRHPVLVEPVGGVS